MLFMQRAVLAVLCLGLTAAQAADNYPVRPIRLITPFAPGGATDVIGRYVATRLGQDLRQQVILDSRPSAGGILACQLAARANPDGYTLLMGSNGTHGMNPGLYSKLPYDAVRDFVPLTRLIVIANVITVHAGVPVKTVRELIQAANAKPGALKYGSSGVGSPPHLMSELFKAMAKADIAHVPYKGGAQSTIALLSGEVEMNFNTVVTSLPHIRSGKTRALGVSSLSRAPALPDVPTIAEAGVAGYEATTWYGMFAPARTPAPIVSRLSAALIAIQESAETRERFVSMGGEAVADRPEAFLASIRSDIPKWRKVIEAAGARAD